VVQFSFSEKFLVSTTAVGVCFAAMFAFLVGVVLSAVNLAWAVFRHALAPSH
jgi:hypothetical protein